MKIKATTMMRYKGSQDEPLVATRFEIAWDDDNFLDVSGLKSYDEGDWELILSVMVLGARRAGIDFVYRDLSTKDVIYIDHSTDTCKAWHYE